MIIGIDLDETISDLPEFFSVITAALVSAGHEVHVITYREIGTEASVKTELAEFGIHYTDLHLPSDFRTAPEWKSELAEKLGVEIMFEDSPEVLARMPGSVKRVWICDPEIFDLDRCVDALRDNRSSTP